MTANDGMNELVQLVPIGGVDMLLEQGKDSSLQKIGHRDLSFKRYNVKYLFHFTGRIANSRLQYAQLFPDIECVNYDIESITYQVTKMIICVVDKRDVHGYTFIEVRPMHVCQHEKYVQLGLNIAYYRKMRGYSQLKLAELVDISRTHMSRIETAECAVSLDVVFNICDALGIAPSKLFDFRD